MTATTQSAPDITHDHFSQAARAGQDAMDTAIRAWGQTWQQFMGDRGKHPSMVPNADELIDTWFDVTGELLFAQREFTKALLTLSQPGLAAVSRAAQQATTATHHVTEQARRPGRPNAANRKDS
ncbi:MAG: hypothetical protein ACRDUV_10075 [Pseudonocardiaceae bacterium]